MDLGLLLQALPIFLEHPELIHEALLLPDVRLEFLLDELRIVVLYLHSVQVLAHVHQLLVSLVAASQAFEQGLFELEVEDVVVQLHILRPLDLGRMDGRQDVDFFDDLVNGVDFSFDGHLLLLRLVVFALLLVGHQLLFELADQFQVYP